MSRCAFLLLYLAAVAVRCWRISAPFDDHWSWRQSDVAAIARNYFENGFRFAYPQIDWAGEQSGFVGTEFPLLPFAAALVYRVTAPRDWVGRAETILFFAASLPFFFLLVRRLFSGGAAVFALVFYCFAPLSIGAGRAFMPDMPSLALALGALYFFCRWLDQPKLWFFALSLALLALSLLIKLPSAVIGGAFAALLQVPWHDARSERYSQRIADRTALLTWSAAFAVLVFIPAAAWYWHATLIARNFYPHHLFGAGGVRVMPLAWYGEIARSTFMESLTPVLCLLAVAGLCLTWGEEGAAPLRWWLGGMILFIIVVGYGNRHPWYQLPLVPIAAAFAGALVARLRRPMIALALALFLAWSGLEARAHFQPASQPSVALGRALRTETPSGALIMIADDGDPTAFYYGHRKGWHLLERDGIFDGNPADAGQIVANVERLRTRGGAYFACARGTAWWLEVYPGFTEYLTRHATVLSATDDYRLYHLNP